jgi:hypothetical protein
MAISNEEKNRAKQKATEYLEKSIYVLSLTLGILPEDALSASSVNDLVENYAGLSEQKQKSVQSLLNQVQALNKLV